MNVFVCVVVCSSVHFLPRSRMTYFLTWFFLYSCIYFSQIDTVGSTSRGSARGESNDNEDEDNNGSDNEGEQIDNDENENENDGEDGNEESTTEKRGRSKTSKRGDKSGRKSKSPHPNKDASGSGSTSPTKRVRRPSMDNIGKFPASAPAAKSGVSLTTLAAAKKTATAVKGKSASKTAKKRRGSFVGAADKPDAGEESEHEEEAEAEGTLLHFCSLMSVFSCACCSSASSFAVVPIYRRQLLRLLSSACEELTLSML